HAAPAAPDLRPVSTCAISCITRPSSAGSICTGRRRWVTIRSTKSGRSSNTFRLSENDLQLLAGAFHPHLQRRYPRAGQLRHLLVLQILDVFEEERFPVFRGELAERPADGIVPLGALGRTGERRTAQRRVVAHEQPRATRCPSARRAAPVHKDAVQPGAESLWIVAARERAMRPDERVLQRFLRVLPVPEHVYGVGAGCYKDDTTSPQYGKPRARVVLTDAPFPYDSVASVNLYVASIAASGDVDTTGGGEWVRVATPDRAFDLLTLQRGATAFLGEAELDARQYRAIRMVIDVDKSSIVYNNGSAP